MKIRIVFVVSLSLLLVMTAVVLVTDWRVRSIVDELRREETVHYLNVVFDLVKRWNGKLQSTGLEDVYLESFQKGVLREISQIYYRGPKKQFPFITNALGEVVLHPVLKKGDRSLAGYFLQGRTEVQETEYRDSSGNDYWVVYKPFPAWGWILGWAMPVSEKYQARRQLMFFLVLVLSASFFFLLGVIWFLVSRIVSPVEIMTRRARDMARGNLDVEIPDFGASNELSVLGRSLDSLRQAIKDKLTELQRSEKQYRDLVQGANSVILRADLNGNILFMNEFGLHLFGYTLEEILGQPMLGTIVPEVDSCGRHLGEMVKKILQHPEDFLDNENENISKDGRRFYIQWTNRTVQSEDGRFVELLSVGIDITRRKELERELVQRQKMEALADLARGIAHDFKNIMGGIFASLEVAQLYAQGEGRILQALDRVHTAAVRARDLIEQIATFTRGDLAKRVEVKLQSLLEEALQIISSSLPPGIKVETSVQASPVILADPTQVFQVLINLCTNALQAMGEHGTLSLKLDIRHLPEQGVFACLLVSDSGPGMSEDVLERIFEPYFTTKGQGRGTGLGLFVVHNIVKNHGGFIKVRSTPGHGSVFEVYFPV